MTKINIKDQNSKTNSQVNEEAVAQRPYDPPRILSIEPLEAVATVCADPPNNNLFGKDISGVEGCVNAQS